MGHNCSSKNGPLPYEAAGKFASIFLGRDVLGNEQQIRVCMGGVSELTLWDHLSSTLPVTGTEFQRDPQLCLV